MNCERHIERPGTLAVDLPSLGIRQYLCEQCRSELDAALAKMPMPARKGRTYRTERVYAGPEGQYSWLEYIEI